MNKLTTAVVTLTAAAGLLAGCGSGSKEQAGGKPTVTVSIEPQRWMLERLAGDRVRVQALLANGANPESYEPSFANLAELEKSAMYLTIGNLPFEDALVGKIRTNRPDLKVRSVSDSLEMIADDHHGHNHGVDPHVWSSAKNARRIAANMLSTLLEADPEGEAVYRENYARLLQTVDSVDSVCTTLLAPAQGTAFMVMHPSLSYFARDYGLEQLSVGAEGKEQSIANTREILDAVDHHGARVFFVDKDFNSANAGMLTADRPEISIVTINPLNYNWDDELIDTARAIAEAPSAAH